MNGKPLRFRQSSLQTGSSIKSLTKSDAEQALLRSVAELEAELLETENTERKTELKEQIDLLKEDLLRLQGPKYSELEKENTSLKGKIKQLEKELTSMRNHYKEEHNVEIPAEAPQKEKESKFQFYKLLLKKFSKAINESSQKTVGEIKTLISKEDLTVQSYVSDFKPDNYNVKDNYLAAAKKIFYSLAESINCVEADIDLSYWLTPTEILTNKIGDDEDLAVLLCSCLYTLGDEKAEVVIAELENLKTHAFAITEFNNKFILLDLPQKHGFLAYSGRKTEVLRKYTYKGAKIKRFLYKFNHNNYEEFQEVEIENELNFSQ